MASFPSADEMRDRSAIGDPASDDRDTPHDHVEQDQEIAEEPADGNGDNGGAAEGRPGKAAGGGERPARTEKQRLASAANGRKSRGPTTEYGKRISSQNGKRHGANSRLVLAPGEDAAELAKLAGELREAFEPETRAEEVLLDYLVDVQWRMRRLARAQAARRSKLWDHERERQSQRFWYEQPADSPLRTAEPAVRREAFVEYLHSRCPGTILLESSEQVLARDLVGTLPSPVLPMMQLEVRLMAQSMSICRQLERLRTMREKAKNATARRT